MKIYQKNLLYWLVRESFRLEYRPYREYCRRFFTSYQELRTVMCLSVPENAICIPRLQSTEPPCPCFRQLLVLIAQSWLLRQTKLESPEHFEQPSLFQNKFCSLPFLNSRACQQNQIVLVFNRWFSGSYT